MIVNVVLQQPSDVNLAPIPSKRSHALACKPRLLLNQPFGYLFWGHHMLLLLQGAADRLTKRVSSLETQLLEGKAALASSQADRNSIVSDLAAAREISNRVEELKAAVTESTTRERALSVKIASLKTALKVRTKPIITKPILRRGSAKCSLRVLGMT